MLNGVLPYVDGLSFLRRDGMFVQDIGLNPVRGSRPFNIDIRHHYTDPLQSLVLLPMGELGWRASVVRTSRLVMPQTYCC